MKLWLSPFLLNTSLTQRTMRAESSANKLWVFGGYFSALMNLQTFALLWAPTCNWRVLAPYWKEVILFHRFLCKIALCHFLCEEGTIKTDYSKKLVEILLGLHDRVICFYLVKVTLPENPGNVGEIVFTRNNESRNACLFSKLTTPKSKLTVSFFLR